MKSITQEWIEKAEGDFRSAQLEMRSHKIHNYDAVCFHAQQCVEKYIKAKLIEVDIPFKKLHDLTYLLELAAPVELLWVCYEQELRLLTDYAVEFRYPSASSDHKMTQKSPKICKSFRIAARQSLGLPTE
jgi:HEPN domain-containing protein